MFGSLFKRAPTPDEKLLAENKRMARRIDALVWDINTYLELLVKHERAFRKRKLHIKSLQRRLIDEKERRMLAERTLKSIVGMDYEEYLKWEREQEDGS